MARSSPGLLTPPLRCPGDLVGGVCLWAGFGLVGGACWVVGGAMGSLTGVPAKPFGRVTELGLFNSSRRICTNQTFICTNDIYCLTACETKTFNTTDKEIKAFYKSCIFAVFFLNFYPWLSVSIKNKSLQVYHTRNDIKISIQFSQ